MWEAGGPEAELVAKESVTVLLQDFPGENVEGPDLGRSGEDQQPSPK